MNQDSISIRLSAQRALLGNVPGTLRAFSAEVSDGVVRLRSIFDESTTEDDVELLSITGQEINDLQPEKRFVVYAGHERYQINDGVEAIGLTELARLLADLA